jgi:SlyX protein
MEDKMIQMDTRILYLEDTIQQMNIIMMEQDKAITRLNTIVKTLNDKIKELDEKKGERGVSEESERPPHY